MLGLDPSVQAYGVSSHESRRVKPEGYGFGMRILISELQFP